MFSVFRAKRNDILSLDADRSGDFEDLVVFDGGDIFVRGRDGIETSKESNPLRAFRQLPKRSGDEMVIAATMCLGGLDGSPGEQCRPIGIDFGQFLQSLRNGIAFGLVRPKIRARDTCEQVAEGGHETSLFGWEGVELGADFGQTGGLGLAIRRTPSDSKET